MVQTLKASVVLASAWSASAVVASSSRSFLASSSGMRPDVVARVLAKVEDQWSAQAAAFVDCSSDNEVGSNCDMPGKAFQKSCGIVVSAAVQASEGDRDRVAEYMNDVCKENVMDARHRARCQSLMTLMVQHMGGDAYSTRETFDSVPLCARFWEKVKSEEKTAMEQHRAEEAKAEAEQKKAEEEDAKRRQAEDVAEEAAVVAAGKKADEAAKAEQEAVAAATAAEESAKRQVQEVTVASIAKGRKTEAKAEPKVEGTKAKVAVDGAQPKVSTASAKVVVDDPKVPAPKAGFDPKVSTTNAPAPKAVFEPKVEGSAAKVISADAQPQVSNVKAPAPKANVEPKVEGADAKLASDVAQPKVEAKAKVVADDAEKSKK